MGPFWLLNANKKISLKPFRIRIYLFFSFLFIQNRNNKYVVTPQQFPLKSYSIPDQNQGKAFSRFLPKQPASKLSMFGAAHTMCIWFIQGSTHPPSRDKSNLTELMFFEIPFTAHNPLFYAHINFDVINPMDNFGQ